MNHKLILLLLCVTPLLAQAANIQISAVKKTESQRTSSRQQLPGGDTQTQESSIFYRFDIKCMDTQVPETAELQYVVVVEEKNGSLSPGAWGKEPIELTFGQEVSIESDSVDVSQRTWSRDHGSGKVQSKVDGYGARIVDDQGEVLAKKFSNPSVEDYLIKLLEDKEEAASPKVSDTPDRLQRRKMTRPPVRTP